MKEIHNTGSLSKEALQEKRNFLDQKEKEIKEALQKGKEKEEEIKQQLEIIQKKIQQMLASKNIPEKKRLGLTKLLTTVSLLIMLIIGKNTGEIKKYIQDKNREVKGIVMPEKKEIILPKDTIVINKEIKKSIVETPAVKEEKKKPEFTVTIKKGPQKERPTIISSTEEDIFVLIEKANPKYGNRIVLSTQEKATVKTLYNQLIATTTEKEMISIVNTIKDLKILRGLRDVLVKKIFISDKQKKDASKYRLISQQTVRREDQLIREYIKKTHTTIQNYTVEPKNFSLSPIEGENCAKYIMDGTGNIQVNYTLKNNGNAVGSISFDNNGKLLNKTIYFDNQNYEIDQKGSSIIITSSSTNSN